MKSAFLFTFSDYLERAWNFLWDKKEEVILLAGLSTILMTLMMMSSSRIFRSFCSALEILEKIPSGFLQRSQPLIVATEYDIERRELMNIVEKKLRNESTRILVISGDVESGKTRFLHFFLNTLQKKRIDLRKYDIIRCNLKRFKSREELLRWMSFQMKERGSDRLYRYLEFEKEFGNCRESMYKGAEEILIDEFNVRRFILAFDNLDPRIHGEILDFINSTMRFYGRTKAILVSTVFPREFNTTDRLYGIVANVPVGDLVMEEISELLTRAGIAHSQEDVKRIRDSIGGNIGLITHLIYILKNIRKCEKFPPDDSGVFNDEEFRKKELQINLERYDEIYGSLMEEPKRVAEMLSALLPCTFGDLLCLYTQLYKPGTSEKHQRERLQFCLDEPLRSLVRKKDGRFYLNDLLKEKIYNDFNLKEEFHKIAQEYYERKLSLSSSYMEDYEFHVLRYKAAVEMECPYCRQTILRNAPKCKHCGAILHDSTNLY